MKKEMSHKKIVLLTFLITSVLYIVIMGYSSLLYSIRKDYQFVGYREDWLYTAIMITEREKPYEQLIDDFLRKEYLKKIYVFKSEDTILLVTEHNLFGLTCLYVDVKNSQYQTFPEIPKNDKFYPRSL
jgi:hypothetical protein